MRLKNKTGMFQKVRKGEQVFVVRPWRIINVPENVKFNKNIFEIVDEKKKVEIKKTIKKSIKKNEGE